jgi:hypothetical protein
MLANTLVTICIACFFGILISLIYMRIRVFRAYSILMKNRIEFGTNHIFNKQKLEAEILPRYPEHKETILRFVNGIRHSATYAFVLTTIATICVAILMFMS